MTLRRGWLVVLALATATSGCLPRNRLNSVCAWTGDAPGHIDLGRGSDLRHLLNDVEIAEEVGVRYGDSFRDHSPPDRGQRRSACTTELLTRIADAHGLSFADVSASRGRRPPLVDAVIFVAVSVLFVLAARRFAWGLFTRVSAHDHVAAVIAIALSSVMAGVIFFGAVATAGTVIEILRFGDGHGSYRVGRLPWGHHWIGLVAFGAVLSSLMASFQMRRATSAQLGP